MERPFKDKRMVGPFVQYSSSGLANNMYLEFTLDRNETVDLMLEKELYQNMQQKEWLENNTDRGVRNVGVQLSIDILSNAGIADYSSSNLNQILDPVEQDLDRPILSPNKQSISLAYEVSSLSPDELADLIIAVRDLDVTVNSVKWV